MGAIGTNETACDSGEETIGDLGVVGDVVLGDEIIVGGMLLVRGEKIIGIRREPSSELVSRLDDYSGCFVLPGLVDSHVHSLSTPTEGIATATEAAAVGGITTIIDMPYDGGAPINSVDRLVAKSRVVEEDAVVDVALLGTLDKLGPIEGLAEMVQAGAVGFKLSSYETDPIRFPKIDHGRMLAAFGQLAGSGAPIVIHAEDQEIIDYLRSSYKGVDVDDPQTHGLVRPLAAECVAISGVLELALHTGARVHIAHISAPRGFELVAEFAAAGAKVTGETCPHYLKLDREDVRRLGAFAKVNPPIREQGEREGLWEQLRAGRVWSIATDHAPWPSEAKAGPFSKAASGMPGLETLLGLMVTEAEKRKVDVCQVVHLMSDHPAKLFGLDHRKGSFTVGCDADIAVYDHSRPWQFVPSLARTSAKWSPLSEEPYTGRVIATYLRGRAIVADGKLVDGPRGGCWLRSGVSLRGV